MSNYFVQDFLSSTIAFVLFPIVFVVPGYVISWRLELFDFRRRLTTTRFIIAIVTSMALMPILSFLTYGLASVKFALALLALFAIAFVAILLRTKGIATPKASKPLQTTALYIAIGWSIFAILSLIDIQWGNRLYYNIVSYDFTTRVAVINAITRTGVPPINPSYFPGHSVHLTFLYYFWYILCSLIAQIGGPFVTGRTAMIASVAWCGIGVMSTIALYLRLRNPEGGEKTWKAGLIGSGLLLISGLDFIPAIFLTLFTRVTSGSSFLQGDIEHWNEQITAWVGAIAWVPHHVAAMLACLTGMMLVLSVRNQGLSKKIGAMVIAGLAFASAFGLSVYVTIAFVLFWTVWMLVLFLQKERQLSLLMTIPGLVALAAAAPFIAGLVGGNSGSSGGFPISLSVRVFLLIVPTVIKLNSILINLIFLLLLPINYLMELGFFFVAGLLWLQKNGKVGWQKNPFHLAEILLLIVVVLIGSFVRSTTISNNDLGWRVWLLGQFVLLIWGVDIIQQYFPSGGKEKLAAQIKKTAQQLTIFLLLGLITTIVDVVSLRTWTMLVDQKGVLGSSTYSADTKLGERTFAARLTYDFINKNLPENIHVQHDPLEALNIPVGLYLDRPMVIAGQTAFGISPDEFDKRVSAAAEIFTTDASWGEIDNSCNQNFIDVIVVNDIDPLWKKLPALKQKRQPLYENNYYAVFACGNFNKTYAQHE
jgi:hypothetical protein